MGDQVAHLKPTQVGLIQFLRRVKSFLYSTLGRQYIHINT